MNSAKPKIVIYDAKTEDEQFFPEQLPDFEVVTTSACLAADTVHLAADAVVVAVFVSSKVDKAMFDAMPELKLIACRSTGFDNIDLAEAKKRKIAVTYAASYGEHTVAEYTFTLILALARKLPQAIIATESGNIDPDLLTGEDIFDKTLGVVGTGRIGANVVRIAQGFGMKVIAFDPFPKPELKQAGVEYLPLEDLLRLSDIVTLHAPATKENVDLINAKNLTLFKNGSYLINTARGSLVDTPAMVEALESGKLAGVGIDVVGGEEYERQNQRFHLLRQTNNIEGLREDLCLQILEDMPNVILTAHNAYNTAGAIHRIRESTAKNITAWHRGEKIDLVPGL